MKRRTVVILGVVILIGAAGGGTTWWLRREKLPVVTTETIRTRDLEAVVSASGKIQPKRLVNISADTSGRVVNLAVNEGDRVSRGQFLLQIDPKSLRSRVEGGTASLQAAEASLEQLRQSVETARVQLQQAQQNLTRQRDLAAQQLNTREALERAENDVKSAESQLREREKQIGPQSARINQERATLDSARYDLSKVRIESPIDGIVTRRNIQEGETAVIGTMNNAGTVLLTLADMSVIQAEVEVDETNLPYVAVGQIAKITIDALPDRTFNGHVTEIGNSPIQQTGAQATQSTARTATNFKVTVTIEGKIPEVRPGFTCTAEITTATRASAVSVPIQAMTVRELLYDAQGNVIPEYRPPKPRFQFRFGPQATANAATPSTTELLPGQKRQETEGVFVVRDDKATFVQVKVGIAGERYLEVLSGLKEGDRVITGPFESVRGMYEGDVVNTPPRPAR
jgi:HlyD family secretion protein